MIAVEPFDIPNLLHLGSSFTDQYAKCLSKRPYNTSIKLSQASGTRATVSENSPRVPASHKGGGSSGNIFAFVAEGWTIRSWYMGKNNSFLDKEVVYMDVSYGITSMTQADRFLLNICRILMRK